MREQAQIAQESTAVRKVPTLDSLGGQVFPLDEDRLVSVARDFLKAAGKDLPEDLAEKISTEYQGDYERMLSDLFKASGKKLDEKMVRAVEKRYRLIEDAPVVELPKEVSDFIDLVEEGEADIRKAKSYSGSMGADSPRMPSPLGFEEAKQGMIDEGAAKIEGATDNFDFVPITLREVVNTVGKRRDDMDEVAQTSKLYMEKYTSLMEKNLAGFEEKLSPNAKGVIDILKKGDEFDDSTLGEEDAAQVAEWRRRNDILSQQEDINKSTIYKKDEIRRKINNAAREAKDKDESVRDAILGVMEEEGIMTEEALELYSRGEFSDYDTWLSTATYNTVKRGESTLKSTWRGFSEALDEAFGEESTTYNRYFLKEFDNFLNTEIDDDIKRLMWGTNKSKYDGDIREKRVDVNGVRLILNEKGDAVGVRKPDGNMSWNLTDREIAAIREYEGDKDNKKNEAYHDFRWGTLGAKGTQVGTDMIPIIAATMATGGAGGTALGTYVVTYGDFYEQQFERTGSVGSATAFATTATAMTAMLEGLGGIEGSIIRNANKKALGESITEAASELASKKLITGQSAMLEWGKTIGKQMLEETGIEVSQSLGEAATEMVFNGDTDISWKELEEVVLLTPFATGPISGALSANSFRNYSLENIKLAAKNPEVFNKMADEWVNAAKTDEQREKRQKDADIKKSLVEELSESLVAVEELGIAGVIKRPDGTEVDLGKQIMDKSVEIVKAKQKLEKARTDKAKGIIENDIAKLRDDVQMLIQEGYENKRDLDQIIKDSEKENKARDERLARKKAEEELNEYKSDPELSRLNIVPDQTGKTTIKHKFPTNTDFEGAYDEDVQETEVGEGLTLRVGKLEAEPDKYGQHFADAIVVDADGNTKAQYTYYADNPVSGTIEVASEVNEEVQRQGLSTQAYQQIANQTGKPIIPGSVSRDFSAEKSGSTFSANAAAFWQRMAAKGVAEEVVVTTKEGKVVRTLAVLPEGFTSTDTVKRIEDSAVEESNVESEAFEQEDTVQTNMDEGTFVLNRKGRPITYKIEKFNENTDGQIISVTAIDPNGKKKTIRSKQIVDELNREKILHEEKITENEITNEELVRAASESGARVSEPVSSERTEQDTEEISREQEFAEGTREDILKENVNYQGVDGRLIKFDDGTYHVITPGGQDVFVEGGQSQATNAELGLTLGKTNLELLEIELDKKKAERSEVRQEMNDIFFEIDQKLPPDAKGDFVEAINEGGGDNALLVASQLAKALKNRIGQNIRDAVGSDLIDRAKKLARRLELINKELSTKKLRKKRKDARIKDSAKEAKQLRAERRAKERAARKRSEGQVEKKTTPKKPPVKKEPIQETKQEGDVIPDSVWNEYVDKNVVPDHVLESIADLVQRGEAINMSERQFAIYSNMTGKVNQILAQRYNDGSYQGQSAEKVTKNAMDVIDRRNNEIADVLRSVGRTPEQIKDTITVFHQAAKRWAEKNKRPIQDFYSDVLVGIEVAELGKGKKGKLVPLDGGYLMQLSQEATVATPVHELAHIFQNFLTPQESQAVLDWAGRDSWDRTTSEMFARGFEQWLQRSENLPDLDAFQRFKQWLLDIYDGIVTNGGEALPSFSPELKQLYTNILHQDIPKHTKESYDKAYKRQRSMFDKMRAEGLQFKKATFEAVKGKVINEATGWKRFAYRQTKMDKLTEQAIKKGYTDAVNANQYAAKELLEMGRDPDYLPTLAPDQLIGYGYALTQMEKAYDDVVDRRKRFPKDLDLLNLQDELSRSIQDLSQVLSIGRSVAGLSLRIGSYRFKQEMYSPEIMKIQARNKLNRDLTASEEAHIEKNSKYISAAMEKFQKAAENLDESTKQELESIVKQMVSNKFENSPAMKEQIRRDAKKTPRQRTNDIATAFDKISKILNDKPDLLLDDKPANLFDEEGGDVQFMREMRNFISLLMASDPTIDSFESLHKAIQDYWPSVNQDKLLNAIVWSDPAYQKSRADQLAGTAAVIKKESRLLDKLRTYLTETYQEVEKTGNKKIYPYRLVELEKLITQIQALAATDYTIDNETFTEASTHLDNLQTLYAGLTLEKIDFQSPNLEDMISKVREYETARKMNRREKQLAELESVISKLRNGTYEGNLNDIVPQRTQKYVDERLNQIADKINIKKGVVESFKDKANKLEILRKIGNIMQKDDGGVDLRTFDALYKSVKEEIPELTKKDMFDAIMYKANPKKIAENLRTARKNMRQEVKHLKRLEDFLQKNKEVKTTGPANRSKLQTELESIVDEIEKFAAVRYENLSKDRIKQLKSKFRDVISSYEGVLSGEIVGMSIEDIINKVSDIKQQELEENLEQNILNKALLTKVTTGAVVNEKNIFELVPEMLPKVVSDSNMRLKRILADEVKHERLLRVNKMLDLMKGMIVEEGGLKEFKENRPEEFNAIRNFLEIEKKSKDHKTELIRLNREVYLKRAAFNEWLQDKYEATGHAKWKAFMQTPRLLVLAGDISFVLYQGGPMLFAHPKIAAHAFGKMVQSAFNVKVGKYEFGHTKWREQLADMSNPRLNPYYGIAIASGLKLVDELSLTLEEELQLTSILESLPGVKYPAKEFRRFGERIYSAYMNHLRMKAFIEGLQAIEKIHGGFDIDPGKYGDGRDFKHFENDEIFTPQHREVVRKLAEHINMHTGSANTFSGNENIDAGINAVLDASSNIFIAPRLYASVYRSTAAMTGIPDAIRLWKLRKEKSSENPMKAFYKYRLFSNLRILAGLGGFHLTMLAAFTGIVQGLAGDDEELEKVTQTVLNPYHTEFLKLRHGQRVFSISPFVSYYRFGARLGFQGAINDGVMADSFVRSKAMAKKTGFGDHAYDFLKYRFNPIVGALEAGLLNKDWNGQPITPYSMFSEDAGWSALDRLGAFSKRSIVPIWGQGIIDNITNRTTVGQTLGEFAIDFVGINSYTVQPYQDIEVQSYLSDAGFKISYKGIPKSLDEKSDEIKANIKLEFGKWLKSEVVNGKKPSKEKMRVKSRQILNQEVKKARN